MKTVYTYHQTTGEYTGEMELDDSDLSPLEPGKYLIPAGATEEAPPAEIAEGNGVFHLHGQWIEKPLPAVEVQQDTDGDGVADTTVSVPAQADGYEPEPDKQGFLQRVIAWIRQK